MSNIFDIITRCDVYYILHIGGHDIKNSKMKALRKTKNLSQIDVANAVGVSRQTIISVENGNYNPTLDLCIRICKLLGVSLDDLFWEEG